MSVIEASTLAVPHVLVIEDEPRRKFQNLIGDTLAPSRGFEPAPSGAKPGAVDLLDFTPDTDAQVRGLAERLTRGEISQPEHAARVKELGLTPVAPFTGLKLPRPESTESLERLGVPIPTSMKIQQGVLSGLADLGEGLADPMMAPALKLGAAGGALGRLIAGIFTGQMATHVPEQVDTLAEAIASEDPRAIAHAGTGLAGTTAFMVGGGKHLMRGEQYAAKPNEHVIEIPDIPPTERGGLSEPSRPQVEPTITPPTETVSEVGGAKPIAPVTFHGETTLGGRTVRTWNLTEDLGGHPKGSTLSQRTIEDLGYSVPTTEGVTDATRVRSNERSSSQPTQQEGQAQVQLQGGTEASRNDLQRETSGEPTAASPEELRKALTNRSEAGFVRLPNFATTKINTPLNAIAELPDFKPLPDATQEFAKITRRSTDTPQDRSVARWYAESHGVAEANTTALAAKLHNEIRDVFKADVNGDLNVEPTTEGQSLKISDVFEELQRDPNAYRLTPDQRRVMDNVINPLLRRMKALGQRYDTIEPKDQYFMRGQTEQAGGFMGYGSRKVGAKQGYQKERAYDTEEQGWNNGEVYNTDVEQRLIAGVRSMYRSIADKRLAEDPALGSKTKAQLRAEFVARYPTKTPKEIKKMVDSAVGKGTVHSPAFRNQIFTKDVADMLNKEFASETPGIYKSLANMNSIAKGVTLGYDFGVNQIQLLPTMFHRPDVWAKATAKSLQAFASPDVFREYVRKPANDRAVKELAELGSPVGNLPEYMQGQGTMVGMLRKGARMAERVGGRGVGLLAKGVTEAIAQPTEAFNRQFQTSLDVAKIELWKAYRDITPKEQWGEAIRSIESTLLSGRMESAGIPHSKAVASRVLFNAPSYYLGALDFVKRLGSGGVSGSIARKAMSRFIMGSMLLYAAKAYQAGMSPDEVKKRLNPASSDFMMWTIQNGDRPLEVGMGGIFKSYVKLVGQVAKSAKESPSDLVAPSADRNPMIRWYRNHAGPVPGLVMSVAKGSDFYGQENTMSGTLGRFTPLAAQAESKAEGARQFFGLDTKPARSPSAEQIAQQLYGKSRNELTVAEDFKVQRATKEAAYPMTRQEKKKQEQLALKYEQKNKDELLKAISPENTAFLKQHKLDLPGYDLSFTVHGTSLPYTDKEKTQFKQDVAVEYNKMIDKLRAQTDWDSLSLEAKKIRLSRVLEGARKVAEAKVIQGRKR